jgi:hypothetical protein
MYTGMFMTRCFNRSIVHSKLHLPILVMLLCACSSSASSQTTSDLDALKTSTNETNVHLQTSLAQQARTQLGRKYTEIVAPQGNPHDVSNGDALNSIAARALDAQRKYDESYSLLKANNSLVKATIGAGLALAPVTGGTSLFVTAAGEATSRGLEYVEDKYKAAAQQAIRQDLRTSLAEYERRASPQDYKLLLSSPDPGTFRERLKNKVGHVFGSDLEKLPQDQQDIVNSFYNRELKNVMEAGFETLSKFQVLQQGQIDANRKDIQGLARTFVQFASKTQDQLNTIVSTQRELVSDLDSMNKRIGKTERGVAFIQSVMFSNMNANDQLTALRSGMFEGMPPEQRKDLEDKLEIVAKREKLTQTVTEYLNGASSLAKIAGALGVDPKIVGQAQVAIAFGNRAVEAFTQFSAGNVLGGIGAVSNMIGIGGPDIADQRHEEIMNTLRMMYTQLKVIDAKLDQLHEDIVRVQQTQILILQSIKTLSEQVQRNQEEIMSELQDIHNDVLYNRMLLSKEATSRYSECRQIVWDQETHARLIDTAAGRYPNWHTFQALYRDNFPEIKDCSDQLRNTKDANEDFKSDVFWLETRRDNVGSSIGPYLAKVYKPAWVLLQSGIKDQETDTLERRIASLLSPVDSVETLDAKLAIVEPLSSERLARFGMNSGLAQLMNNALASEIVAQHDQYVTDVHYYQLLLDPKDNLRDLSDLFHGIDLRMSGRSALIKALSLTDIAIAQKALVNGDSLLPVLASILEDHRNATPEAKALFKQVAALLRSNSILAQNLVLYMIRTEVEKHSNFMTYDLGLASRDTRILDACTGSLWSFRFSEKEEKKKIVVTIPKGWSLDIDGALYSLPSSVDLYEGRFQYSDDLYMLLNWRNRILEEIAAYDVFKETPADQRPAITEVILNHVVAARVSAPRK